MVWGNPHPHLLHPQQSFQLLPKKVNDVGVEGILGGDSGELLTLISSLFDEVTNPFSNSYQQRQQWRSSRGCRGNPGEMVIAHCNIHARSQNMLPPNNQVPYKVVRS